MKVWSAREIYNRSAFIILMSVVVIDVFFVIMQDLKVSQLSMNRMYQFDLIFFYIIFIYSSFLAKSESQ